MASMKLEEQLKEQVYLTAINMCLTPLISHRRKSRALIIAKKKGEMPQIPMTLNCQNLWKERKVCDWNAKLYNGNIYTYSHKIH
jgi:hypothetical protein